MRDYCKRMDMTYLLAVTEYRMEGCTMMLDAVLIFIALYFLNVAMAITGLLVARSIHHLGYEDDDRSLLKVSFSQPWIGLAFVIGLVHGYLSKIWNIDE